jgi:2-oxoacid:acceptor oxidoreductase delta subunit (pyruvate/2-ketoisovalerate family)
MEDSAMGEDVYKELCETMAKRGGRYPGMDIPEFYELARALFTEEEAAVANAMPRGFNPASAVAQAMGKPEEAVGPILEEMADKGLCTAGRMGDVTLYGGPPFVPGIFEFQFMRGTHTEHDKKLAKLIKAYKVAHDARKGPPKVSFPVERVIPVDRKIKAGNKIHTYDQVAAYIDRYDPLAVSTCFCRHQAELIDEKDDCGKPNEVCMQFGMGAQFVIDRGMGRKITREEAQGILAQAEEAGLVHATMNRQEIDFLCNCCSCHCIILKTALAQPRPGLALNSGFRPVWDADLCTACETCLDRCPTGAIAMDAEDVPEVDLDRCIGCGVCATGCPEEAIALEERPEIPVPPADHKALKAAIKAGRAAS